MFFDSEIRILIQKSIFDLKSLKVNICSALARLVDKRISKKHSVDSEKHSLILKALSDSEMFI